MIKRAPWRAKENLTKGSRKVRTSRHLRRVFKRMEMLCQKMSSREIMDNAVFLLVLVSGSAIIKKSFQIYLLTLEEHVTCLMPETPLSWDDLDGDSVVKMVCDSAKCTRPHHLTHAACFNKLEAFGVAQLKGKKGRAREWSDAERKRVS